MNRALSRLSSRRPRGFLLLELAIALVVVGALVALVVPLLSMVDNLGNTRRDSLAMEQAREALLRQAMVANGLPAPIAFDEGVVDTTAVSSHADLSPTLQTLGLGWAGALPGTALGVSTQSSVQTAYWYDAQPALRADPAADFLPAVAPTDGLNGVTHAYLPIVQQFDPDLNPNMSTGGQRSQLCRNLNSLLAIEQSIRAHTAGSPADYRRDHLNITLPRLWATGFESRFVWDPSLGYATFTAPANTTRIDAAFEYSSAAAFVVVRRQPPAQRRLDRQNLVYPQAGTTGLDVALADRGDTAYPPAALSGERGFRIYENPLTPALDNPLADNSDYAGRVEAVSLANFASTLQAAGMCKQAAETCKANQLYVRFSNSVRALPVSGGGTANLTLRWELVDAEGTLFQSADVASGSTTDGICLDAFGTEQASATATRYLRVSFISPSGTKGYPVVNPNDPYWFKGGVLADPTPTVTTDDAGTTRWRPRSALSAPEGGKTVTIGCAGLHSVTSTDPSGELVSTGTLPTCTVTQLP